MDKKLHIKNLIIQNFRGIKKAEIKNFTNLNIFVGENNCGKTSILEALWVFSGMGQATLGFRINSFRSIVNFKDLDLLFYNQNLKNKPIIQSNSKKVTLKLSKKENTILNTTKNFNTLENTYFDTLKAICFDKETKKTESELYLENGQIKEKNHRLKLPFNARIATGNLGNEINLKGIDFIRDYGKSETITKILKKIDPLVENWEMGTHNQVKIKIKGAPKLRSLNAMGDGLKKVFSLMSKMYDLEYNVLLIDEIENGLHYKSIKVVLESLLEFINLFPATQIFATTHSLDFLKSIGDLMAENLHYEKIKVFSVRKYDDEHKIWEYKKENILYAMEQETEIR